MKPEIKTETKLIHTSGKISYYTNKNSLLDCWNLRAELYEIRNNNELWHKGHDHKIGTIETIPAREINK